jgi:hypothetical protein
MFGVALLGMLAAVDSGVPAENTLLSPSEIYARVSQSVFVVRSDKGIGSGVVVAPERIITNHHVVTGAKQLEVSFGELKLRATVLKSDAQRDLALLSIPGLKQTAPKRRVLLSIRVGERAYALGTPEGVEQTFSEGIVSAIRKDEDGYARVQHTAPITFGSSGGGLFDEQGRLLGINTFFRKSDGQHSGELNFAGPADWIDEMLADDFVSQGDGGTTLLRKRPMFSALRRPDVVDCKLQQELRFAPTPSGKIDQLIGVDRVKGELFLTDFSTEFPTAFDDASPPLKDVTTLSAIDIGGGVVHFAGSRWAPDGLKFFFEDDGSIRVVFSTMKYVGPARSPRGIVYMGLCTVPDSDEDIRSRLKRASSRGPGDALVVACNEDIATACVSLGYEEWTDRSDASAAGYFKKACLLANAEGCCHALEIYKKIPGALSPALLNDLTVRMSSAGGYPSCKLR